jgi:hypothetical protein
MESLNNDLPNELVWREFKHGLFALDHDGRKDPGVCEEVELCFGEGESPGG